MSKYVVYFDDGTMLGYRGRFTREFPNAEQFTSKRAAEKAARAINKPSTVESIESENSAPATPAPSPVGADSAAAAVNGSGATFKYNVSVWQTRNARQNWADPLFRVGITAAHPDAAGRFILREFCSDGYTEVHTENGDFCGEVTL